MKGRLIGVPNLVKVAEEITVEAVLHNISNNAKIP
jgi:hypothetical protein